MMKCRGQVTLEFIVIIAIAFIIFLIIFSFISQERRSANQMVWSQDAQNLANSIADNINSVYLAGNGARINMTLPIKLIGAIDYGVTVRRRLVTVSTPLYEREFDSKTQVADVCNSYVGLNVVVGEIMIVNMNNTVCIYPSNPIGPTTTSTSSTTTTTSSTTTTTLGMWYDQDWKCRVNITVDHRRVSGYISDFPLMVALDNSNFNFSKAQAGGHDIRFTTPDNTTLAYETEDWDTIINRSWMWVRLPSLSPLEDTVIYMYFCNPAASSGENKADVWNSNFVAVWHLNSTLDSTGHGFNLITHNFPSLTNGKAGWAYNLDNTLSQYLNVNTAVVDSWNLTVSAWFKSHSAATSQCIWYNGYQAVANMNYIHLAAAGAEIGEPVMVRYKPYDILTTGDLNATTPEAYSADQWYYAVGTFNT
jgi:hypothetical protein